MKHRLAALSRHLPAAVFLVGVCCAAAAALVLQRRIDSNGQAAFQRSVERVADEVQRRFGQPIYGLNGVLGLYAASPRVDRAQFHAAIAAHALPTAFPGVRGFGFVRRVARRDVPRYIAAQRADSDPGYSVHGYGDRGHDDLFLIEFAEPGPTNAAALGLDMGSEPRRRAAFERAIDSGAPTLSALVPLLPEQRPVPGFLLYVPVFRNHAAVATAAQRRVAFAGMLYAPLVASDLLANIFDAAVGRVDFDLFDAPDGTAAGQLCFSSSAQAAGQGDRRVGRVDRRHFSALRVLSLPGRQLTLRVRGTALFEETHRDSSPWQVFAAGALASVLLAALLHHQAIGRGRADALAEQRLRASEAFLDRTGRIGGVGGWQVDLATQNIEWTDQAYRIHDIELGGRVTMEGARQLYAPEAWNQFTAAIERALQRGPVCDIEVPMTTAKGRAIWVRLVGEAQFDGGQPTRIVGAIQDVTARRAMQAEAEAASRAKSEFIATISHELRTPLQSIIGFSELGQHFSAAQPRFSEMFGDIHAGGQRMLALVNVLLDLSKVYSNLDALVLGRHDLGGLLRDVLKELQPLAARRGLQLDLPAPLPVLPADVDPLPIQQVMRNVLANALRFAPHGSRIEISAGTTRADRPGGVAGIASIEIGVRDHGPGIPADELETIFDAFVQSSRTRDGSGGTGLGLTICRKILGAHGGSIVASNPAGGGTLMRIRLPCSVPGGAAAGAPGAHIREAEPA